jgi:GDP-4-dehydro-6-deoxy-D-mannose reductase
MTQGSPQKQVSLVTGVSGFVGRHLVNHLLEKGDSVVGTTRDEFSHPLFPVAQFDIADAHSVQDLVQKYKPDYIYHLAGMAFVPEAEENLMGALSVHVAGVNNILRSCTALDKPCKVVLVSSGEVFGKVQPEELPLTEKSPVRPLNNYSLTKYFGELVGEKFIHLGRLSVIVARPFAHIGPYQNDRFVVSSFAKQLAMIALGRAEPVIRVGNLAAKRDFTDVRDVVRGYRLAAHSAKSGLYVFCSGKSVQIQTLLDQLLEVSGVKVRVEVDPSRLRAIDIPDLHGSYNKALTDFGWHPEYDIRETLKDVFSYWIETLSSKD